MMLGPLVAVGVCMIIEHAFSLGTLIIRDKGSLGGALPKLHLPDVPMDSNSIIIILKYGL